MPPPPRKVVIERLAALPAKPQSVLIERWLPYAAVKRRVIFRAAPPNPVVVAPRNIIVQWEAPEVHVRKEYKYLGVVRANPADYVHTFGASLRLAHHLPDFVHEIKTPAGLMLAADHAPPALHELEGDLHALQLVDLDKEGLADYRDYLTRLGVLENVAVQVADDAQTLDAVVTQIFHTMDRSQTGRIDVEDAEKTLLRLNSRLGRRYGEDDVRAFFGALDVNSDGSLDLDEFKRAFLNVAV